MLILVVLQCACNLCLFLPAGELDSQLGQEVQDTLNTIKQTLDEQVSKTICSLHHSMTASSGCLVKPVKHYAPQQFCHSCSRHGLVP
jgi:hypothetical protein